MLALEFEFPASERRAPVSMR